MITVIDGNQEEIRFNKGTDVQQHYSSAARTFGFTSTYTYIQGQRVARFLLYGSMLHISYCTVCMYVRIYFNIWSMSTYAFLCPHLKDHLSGSNKKPVPIIT